MRNKLEFLKCDICGNIAFKMVDKGTKLSCCGQEMKLLTENTVDAAKEKHVPDIKVIDGVTKITIGSTVHPMEEKHYIEFIVAKNDNILIFKELKPNEEPSLTTKEDVKVAYEHCNLHGLWKADK